MKSCNIINNVYPRYTLLLFNFILLIKKWIYFKSMNKYFVCNPNNANSWYQKAMHIDIICLDKFSLAVCNRKKHICVRIQKLYKFWGTSMQYILQFQYHVNYCVWRLTTLYAFSYSTGNLIIWRYTKDIMRYKPLAYYY